MGRDLRCGAIPNEPETSFGNCSKERLQEGQKFPVHVNRRIRISGGSAETGSKAHRRSPCPSIEGTVATPHGGDAFQPPPCSPRPPWFKPAITRAPASPTNSQHSTLNTQPAFAPCPPWLICPSGPDPAKYGNKSEHPGNTNSGNRPIPMTLFICRFRRFVCLELIQGSRSHRK